MNRCIIYDLDGTLADTIKDIANSVNLTRQDYNLEPLSLDHIVSDAMAEAQIESLVIAKGYEDCVAYMSDGLISIAVSAPETGLKDEDVAVIADIVTTQTDFEIADIRVIEVK